MAHDSPRFPLKGSVKGDIGHVWVTLGFLLGGPWELVIPYNWAYDPTSNWDNLHKATKGD